MLRRKFLRNLSFLSITSFVGWAKLFKWFKPISPLPTTTKTIFADNYDGSIWLRLLDPRGLSLPEMTVREFACIQFGYDIGEVSDYFLETECYVRLDELDDIVPSWRVEEYWYQYKEEIHSYLGGLFISDDLSEKMDWYCGTNDFYGVIAPNREVVEELWAELKEIGEDVQIIYM